MNMRPEDVPEVHEETFRYPGPKPSSKETAIISLADTVESASRSMERPTPQRIGDLVGKIIHDRVTDGQLDESPLTFADFRKIGESFKSTLVSMLHARIAYPEHEEAEAPADRKSARPAA